MVLPNVGREQHAYLTHIVRNYDSLADWTVFLHGKVSTCGFFLDYTFMSHAFMSHALMSHD